MVENQGQKYKEIINENGMLFKNTMNSLLKGDEREKNESIEGVIKPWKRQALLYLHQIPGQSYSEVLK